jgi:hypothetical protein
MTPHDHWSQFDENLEMLEFNRLQLMSRLGERILDGDWDRLVRLAQAAGYGEADSFLTDFGTDGSNDTIEQAVHREVFESYQDGQYWASIDRSQGILGHAKGKDFVDDTLAVKVCDAMRDAYEKGRALRIEMEEAPAAPTPAP